MLIYGTALGCKLTNNKRPLLRWLFKNPRHLMTLIFYTVLLAKKIPKHLAKWMSPLYPGPPLPTSEMLPPPGWTAAAVAAQRPGPPRTALPCAPLPMGFGGGGAEDAASRVEQLVQFWLWGIPRWCERAGVERKRAQKSNQTGFQDGVRGPQVTPGLCSQLRGTPSLFPFLQFCNNSIYKDQRVRCTLVPWGPGKGGHATFTA